MEENKKFYYATSEGKPIGTVCLIENEKEWARGVAICSELDSFMKKKGRHIAEGRARKALKRKVSTMPILRDIPRTNAFINETLGNIGGKSIYRPVLSVFEESLLNKIL